MADNKEEKVISAKKKTSTTKTTKKVTEKTKKPATSSLNTAKSPSKIKKSTKSSSSAKKKTGEKSTRKIAKNTTKDKTQTKLTIVDSKYQKIGKVLDKSYVDILSESPIAKEVYTALSNGKNSYLRMNRYESTAYDETWINKIEDTLDALSTIINNPKKTIKEVSDIVPIELAKKTTSESVRHLIQHSELIKSIDEKGNIIPNKILNISSDDDYKIYENKFVATLIKRLMLFVEKRYEFITRLAPRKETEVLYYKNDSVIDGMEVHIETKVEVKRDVKAHEMKKNNNYLKRLEEIRRYSKYFYGSEFMRLFKNERDVRSPIIMTNILRKNPDYHKCYELFKFIERYDGLGISYSVEEKFQDFTPKEIEKVNHSILSDFLALGANEPYTLKSKTKPHIYTPTILEDFDDDIFTYSQIRTHKPLKFIRIDEEYLQDVENILNQEKIRENASIKEKEYFAQLLEKKKLLQAQKLALGKLQARKDYHAEIWNKNQEMLQERANRLDVLIQRCIEQEKERLRQIQHEKMRQFIIQQATNDKALDDKLIDELHLEEKVNTEEIIEESEDVEISGIKDEDRLSTKILAEIIENDRRNKERRHEVETRIGMYKNGKGK